MEVHGVSSWVDRRNGVVVVEDDVQNVVRGVKEISDRLHVYYNPQTEGFDVVESCLDGTDRLVFSASQLDNRVLDRLRQADHWHGEDTPRNILGEGEDFVAQVDAHNARLEELQREAFHDQMGEVTERLAWALDNTKDHHSVGGSIRVPRSISGESHKS